MGSLKGDVQRRQQKGAVSSTHQRFFWGRDIGPVLQSVLHMCCCHASWTHARADYGGCRSREPIEERGHKRKKKGESCIGEGIYWSSKSAAAADLLSVPRRLNWIGPPSLGGDRNTQQRMFKVIFFLTRDFWSSQSWHELHLFLAIWLRQNRRREFDTELKSKDKFVVLATDKCFSVKLSFSERSSCVLLSLSDLFRRMLITSNAIKDDDNDPFEPPHTWTTGTCVWAFCSVRERFPSYYFSDL